MSAAALAVGGADCGGGDRSGPKYAELADASAERGEAALRRYGCDACHAIPGMPPPRIRAAAPIGEIATQGYIAGVLPSTPRNLVRWIRFPREVKTQTAMPDLGVSEAEAKDIAAYLYSRH